MQKVAFISDIHFGELARSNEFTLPGQTAKGETTNSASLSEGLSRILKDNNVKYLFVGGDLTSRARPQEFYYCEKRIESIAQQADISTENIIWGIGNHDIDWMITSLCEKYKSESPDVYNVARESYRLIANNAAYHNMKIHPKMKEVGPIPSSGIVETDDFLAFVLNSALYCSHDQEFRHGKLTDTQLQWFEGKAKQYQNNNKWKIVLLHHHPYNYAYHTSGVDVSTLEEGSSLADIAGNTGIHLILHGHRHHPRAETVQKTHWKKEITFICGGSLSVNAEGRSNGDIPNTFHIISLTDNPGILFLHNYEYSASEGWKLLRNNKPETPLDAEMKLGKIISEQTVRDIIKKMGQYSEKTCSLSWNDYDDTLHYWGVNKINNLINEILATDHMIYGEFPKGILLERKEASDDDAQS